MKAVDVVSGRYEIDKNLVAIGGKEDTAAAKMKIMEECGIHVVKSPATIGDTMLSVLKEAGVVAG